MQYSSYFKRFVPLLVTGGLLFSVSQGTMAAEPTHSIMMPKADHSLLLSVQSFNGRIAAAGERGHILFSSDKGNTWKQAAVPTAQMLNSIYFLNDALGWAVGYDGNIVRTTDAGKTWELVRDGLQAQKVRNEQQLKEANADIRRYTKMITNGAVADEQGRDLTEQLDKAKSDAENAKAALNDAEVTTPPLMDVWFANDKRGFAVGAFGTILSTNDGGKTWNNRMDEFAAVVDGYHLNTVTGTKQGLVVVAGEAGFLTISRDYGETWEKHDWDNEGTFFGAASNDDGSLIVAVGLRGMAYRSTDYGKSWQELDSGIDYSLADAAIKGDDVLLVGAGGYFALSHDRGEHFTQYVLSNRSSLSQGAVLDNGQLILVGQGGVHHFNAVDKE